MVDAGVWLDQNYPKGNRSQITELDVSNQNLEGDLDIADFTSLIKLNCSFNKLTSWLIDYTFMEEVDFSHNKFSSSIVYSMQWTPIIKKVNLSHNSFYEVINYDVPTITHLDVSSNVLINLDLHGARNLTELNFSNNSYLANLSLPASFNPVFFDCRGTGINGLFFSNLSSSFLPTATNSTSPTVYINNNNPALAMGLGIPLGVSVLGWLVLGLNLLYKCKNNPLL